jgi:hypothetical protein
VHNETGDYDGNGMYVSKGWKVCDCINGPGLKAGSLAIDLPDHLEEKLNFTAQIISSFLETKIDKMKLSPVVEKITEVVDGKCCLSPVLWMTHESSMNFIATDVTFCDYK